MSRVTISAVNEPAVTLLCSHYSRSLNETAAALSVIGLQHLDELGSALLRWATHPAPLPDTFETPTEDGTALPRIAIRLPELHHKAVDYIIDLYAVGVGAGVRSALAWIGLHHVDELPDAYTEVAAFKRHIAVGVTVGDHYMSTIREFYPDPDVAAAPTILLDVIRQLRAGVGVTDLGLSTGLPRKLLTALSVEAMAAAEGSLPLTG